VLERGSGLFCLILDLEGGCLSSEC
jgi:hypothetical protein